ncbi:hypothetical protein Q7P37_010613 [Cladosporium fusiforme]
MQISHRQEPSQLHINLITQVPEIAIMASETKVNTQLSPELKSTVIERYKLNDKTTLMARALHIFHPDHLEKAVCLGTNAKAAKRSINRLRCKQRLDMYEVSATLAAMVKAAEDTSFTADSLQKLSSECTEGLLCYNHGDQIAGASAKVTKAIELYRDMLMLPMKTKAPVADQLSKTRSAEDVSIKTDAVTKEHSLAKLYECQAETSDKVQQLEGKVLGFDGRFDQNAIALESKIDDRLDQTPIALESKIYEKLKDLGAHLKTQSALRNKHLAKATLIAVRSEHRKKLRRVNAIAEQKEAERDQKLENHWDSVHSQFADTLHVFGRKLEDILKQVQARLEEIEQGFEERLLQQDGRLEEKMQDVEIKRLADRAEYTQELADLGFTFLKAFNDLQKTVEQILNTFGKA